MTHGARCQKQRGCDHQRTNPLSSVVRMRHYLEAGTSIGHQKSQSNIESTGESKLTRRDFGIGVAKKSAGVRVRRGLDFNRPLKQKPQYSAIPSRSQGPNRRETGTGRITQYPQLTSLCFRKKEHRGNGFVFRPIRMKRLGFTLKEAAPRSAVAIRASMQLLHAYCWLFSFLSPDFAQSKRGELRRGAGRLNSIGDCRRNG